MLFPDDLEHLSALAELIRRWVSYRWHRADNGKRYAPRGGRGQARAVQDGRRAAGPLISVHKNHTEGRCQWRATRRCECLRQQILRQMHAPDHYGRYRSRSAARSSAGFRRCHHRSRQPLIRRRSRGSISVDAVSATSSLLLPHEFLRLAAVPVGIALALLGYALWSERRETVSQPPPRGLSPQLRSTGAAEFRRLRQMG